MSLIRNDIPALLVHFLPACPPWLKAGQKKLPTRAVGWGPCTGRGSLPFGMVRHRRLTMLLIPNHIPALLVKI